MTAATGDAGARTHARTRVRGKPTKKVKPSVTWFYGLGAFKCPHCGKLTEVDLHGFDAHGPLGTLRKKMMEADRDG